MLWCHREEVGHYHGSGARVEAERVNRLMTIQWSRADKNDLENSLLTAKVCLYHVHYHSRSSDYDFCHRDDYHWSMKNARSFEIQYRKTAAKRNKSKRGRRREGKG